METLIIKELQKLKPFGSFESGNLRFQLIRARMHFLMHNRSAKNGRNFEWNGCIWLLRTVKGFKNTLKKEFIPQIEMLPIVDIVQCD